MQPRFVVILSWLLSTVTKHFLIGFGDSNCLMQKEEKRIKTAAYLAIIFPLLLSHCINIEKYVIYSVKIAW